MSTGRDNLSKAYSVIIATIEAGIPALVEARELVADFPALIRRRAGGKLDPWLERARASLITVFANGVTKDRAAVAPPSRAIDEPGFNAPIPPDLRETPYEVRVCSMLRDVAPCR